MRLLSGAGAVLCLLGAVAPAAAQVRYAPPTEQFYLVSPYDESYGTSPTYEIFPGAYGPPAVRVIARCQYPNGWNVTDFDRDLNGIPAGIEHTCPVYRGRLHSRY